MPVLFIAGRVRQTPIVTVPFLLELTASAHFGVPSVDSRRSLVDTRRHWREIDTQKCAVVN